MKNLVLACALVPMLATAALAQEPGHTKSGFNGGLTLGFGEISVTCATCDESDNIAGGSLDLHLGYMITPTIAIMLDDWLVSGTKEGMEVTHNIATIGARFWGGPKWYGMGGIGGSSVSIKFPDLGLEAESETKAAIMLGAGYELYQGEHFVLDLMLKYGAGFHENTIHNVGLNLGANWY